MVNKNTVMQYLFLTESYTEIVGTEIIILFLNKIIFFISV
jgi:hypothetical protein